ncbi:MAG: hypothetical protein LBI06_06010 [Treponema sp.]|nr:hypothetical protein [Treponema sp.]
MVEGAVLKTVKVKDGQTVQKPSESFAGPNETFFGWFQGLDYDNGGPLEFDFSMPIKKDIKIYGRAASQRFIGNVSVDKGLASLRGILGISENDSQGFRYVNPNGCFFDIDIVYELGAGFYICFEDDPGVEVEIDGNKIIFNNFFVIFASPDPKLIFRNIGTDFEAEFVEGFNFVSKNYKAFPLNSPYNPSRVPSDFKRYVITNDRDFSRLSPELRQQFGSQAGAHKLRIRDASPEAVYVSGGNIWPEGYYYRVSIQQN